MNRESITPQADLEPITIEQMIALAPSLFTASARFLEIEAQRTRVNSASTRLQPTYGWSA